MIWHGALLIDKPSGPSSFGVIEELKRILQESGGFTQKTLPKLGHGGTLDPFATGLLVVLVGRGTKLAQYFLGADKTYVGVIRFGETTVPGDPTEPISEKNENVPKSLEEIGDLASRLTRQEYLQIPPMHSAKKHKGKPLYRLARQGIEIEREPKPCLLHQFEVTSYDSPHAAFRLKCSSGTYVRTLAQDVGRLLGTVALLAELRRVASGQFGIDRAATLDLVREGLNRKTPLNELACWVPFNLLLSDFDQVEATHEEWNALQNGRQEALFQIIRRTHRLQPEGASEYLVINHRSRIGAIARFDHPRWKIEKVFPVD